MEIFKSPRGFRYDEHAYDAPGSSHLLGMLPALFGGAAMLAGLDMYGPPSAVAHYRPAKRLNSYPVASVGSYRIRERDFGVGSRKFSVGSIRRYKVSLRRRKFYKAAHKLFF